MREISPAVGISADEYLNLAPEIRPLIMEIRRQKRAGERLRPSVSLVDRSRVLTPESRMKLLDKIAGLVDENYAGRSEMCQQFADLLHRALTHMHFPPKGVVGTTIYYGAKGDEVFRWSHAWVRIGEEAIDGNVDSLAENPLVPKQVRVAPYWGPVTEVPGDRRLRANHGRALPPDVDVERVWWPEFSGTVVAGDRAQAHPKLGKGLLTRDYNRSRSIDLLPPKGRLKPAMSSRGVSFGPNVSTGEIQPVAPRQGRVVFSNAGFASSG